jgi:hypothetical protein
MVNASKKFDPASLKANGRLMFNRDMIPPEMPVLKGDYVLVAILCGHSWHYGQFIHNPGFYHALLRHAAHGQEFKVTGLYSIHRNVLAHSVSEYFQSE